MSYQDILPIKNKIEPDRQGARRHYGVHPYFTRRPYNVVRDYIERYSQPLDLVLDPFGGSGVTAIEAYLLSRVGIQNDINPLANFISNGLYFLSIKTEQEVKNAFVEIIDGISGHLNLLLGLPDNEFEANWPDYQIDYKFPENVKLPKNSDVEYYYDLFTKKQLISLVIIKSEIEKIEDSQLKHIVLTAWSATLSKINKTFLSTDGRKESRGGSSIFSIYRYKIASNVVELNPLEVFTQRVRNIVKAHSEILHERENSKRKYGIYGNYLAHNVNAIELNKKYSKEIDYIFTDPPYGGHIAYLDLSTLWNIWLGNSPTVLDFQNELIVGGNLKHTEEFYIQNLAKSISAMSDMLKENRFLSIVFQHKDVRYFEAILDSAFDSKCELIASVPQGTGTIWSMHKKKGVHTVIAGEFILTFQKRKNQIFRKRSIAKKFDELLSDYFNEKQTSTELTEEEVFNDLIIRCWSDELLQELNYSALDIPNRLKGLGFQYDTKNHKWAKSNITKPQIEMFI
ncbi:MAG: DNA methyltransferase [Bacteroidota bacterium]